MPDRETSVAIKPAINRALKATQGHKRKERMEIMEIM